MIVRCIRSINTMFGTRSFKFVIAVAFDMEHYPYVKNALGGENKEMCYIYSAGTRKNSNSEIYSYLYASYYRYFRILIL